MVAYNNKKYYIDIIETKPSNAISIIETDCEVDFAPPLDYKEPERPAAPVSTGKAPAEGKNKTNSPQILGPLLCHVPQWSNTAHLGFYVVGLDAVRVILQHDYASQIN